MYSFCFIYIYKRFYLSYLQIEDCWHVVNQNKQDLFYLGFSCDHVPFTDISPLSSEPLDFDNFERPVKQKINLNITVTAKTL